MLLAYPLVGPNLKRFAHLVRGYRSTTFRATVDHPDAARALAAAAAGFDRQIPVMVDLEDWHGSDRHRPGRGGRRAVRARRRGCPDLVPDGLHAYDGQIHDSDPPNAAHAVQPGLERTLALRDRLLKQGLPVPRLVVGGTPHFPIHAELDLPGVECSPGTTVFHDDSYQSKYPDLHFTPAALALDPGGQPSGTRPALPGPGLQGGGLRPGRPAPGCSTLDDARPVLHSEEHLVVETAQAEKHPDRNAAPGHPDSRLPHGRPAPPRLHHRRRPGRRPVGSHSPRPGARNLTAIWSAW